MKLRLSLILALALILTACAAPAATQAPPPQPTSAPAAPAPTQAPEPTVPPVGIAPPASGGAAVAPTPAATAVTSGTSGKTVWTPIAAANPPPARFDHTITLDTANNKLVVFGGRDGSKTLGDTWIYDLKSNAWREVKASPAPEARLGHAAAFDAKSKRVLIFAGQASGFFNDVWAFDAAEETWQKLETKGTPPAARYGTSAVIDAKRNLLIVTHGFASGRFDDTFALDLATNTWSQINPIDGMPLKRCLHESVYDAKSDRMILFGGCSSGFGPCPQGDLWSLNVGGKDWNEVSPAAIKP
ncbi:MAG: Kelch repeat-containing protein, partial [Anaerolineae bacterium]